MQARAGSAARRAAREVRLGRAALIIVSLGERYRRDGMQGKGSRDGQENDVAEELRRSRWPFGCSAGDAACRLRNHAAAEQLIQSGRYREERQPGRKDRIRSRQGHERGQGEHLVRRALWQVPRGRALLAGTGRERTWTSMACLCCRFCSSPPRIESHERNSISSAAYAIFCCPQPAGTRMHSGQHIAASGRDWRHKGCCGHKISWSCIGMLPEFAVSASASRSCYHISEKSVCEHILIGCNDEDRETSLPTGAHEQKRQRAG